MPGDCLGLSWRQRPIVNSNHPGAHKPQMSLARAPEHGLDKLSTSLVNALGHPRHPDPRLRYVDDWQDKTINKSIFRIGCFQMVFERMLGRLVVLFEDGYCSLQGGIERRRRAPLFPKAKSCQVSHPPPGSPSALAFKNKHSKHLHGARDKLQLLSCPSCPWTPRAPPLSRRPRCYQKASSFGLACNSTCSLAIEKKKKNPKQARDLSPSSVVQKKHWGNTSPIDATRRRKLSPSLLPRVPRSSQLPKLLCASFDLQRERLLMDMMIQMRWRRGCSRAEPVAVVASGCYQISTEISAGGPMTRTPMTASYALSPS